MKPFNQVRAKAVGANLDPKMLDFMNDEQLVQLYEMHKAANGDEETDPSEHSQQIKSKAPDDVK